MRLTFYGIKSIHLLLHNKGRRKGREQRYFIHTHKHEETLGAIPVLISVSAHVVTTVFPGPSGSPSAARGSLSGGVIHLIHVWVTGRPARTGWL